MCWSLPVLVIQISTSTLRLTMISVHTPNKEKYTSYNNVKIVIVHNH
jgi:hypothetical protein